MSKKDFWFTLILFLSLAATVPIAMLVLKTLKIIDTSLVNLGL